MLINKNVIGFKFGEFSFSRKPFFYPKKDKKSKKR
jgi:ribosomal protein S19